MASPRKRTTAEYPSPPPAATPLTFFSNASRAEEVSATPAPPNSVSIKEEKTIVGSSTKAEALLLLQSKVVERRSVHGNARLRHFDSAEFFSGPGRASFVGKQPKRKSVEDVKVPAAIVEEADAAVVE